MFRACAEGLKGSRHEQAFGTTRTAKYLRLLVSSALPADSVDFVSNPG